MKRSLLCLGTAAVMTLTVAAAAGAKPVKTGRQAIGQFDHNADVGTTHFPGKAAYNAKTKTYRVTASGANIWGPADAFHYIDKQATGDLSIAATIAFEGQGNNPHRKAGVMLRQDDSPDSPYVDVMVHGSGLVSLQYRETKGGDTHEIASNTQGVTRVKLEVTNGYAHMWLATKDGVLHDTGGEFPVHFTGPYRAGLGLSSHDDTVQETADFSDVEIAPVTPYIAKMTGYGAKVESTLEILTVGRNDRSLVYHTADHIEAPNWSPDGKTFLFNSDGHLYTMAVPEQVPEMPQKPGQPVLLDTGPEHKINNDHGFAPDGKWVAFSDNSQPDNQSRIYIIPLTPQATAAGPARQITADGPSYWHGWTNDDSTVGAVEQKNGDFDISTYPVAGGAPTQLTNSPGLDDGADYSPDGKYIYFNSVRSGNMKIWRMNADGSNPIQVTTGDSRDWFPHPSPDGKWIAFISFEPGEVTAGDHPPNKNVMIKIMPVSGGEPKIVAKLFGGQGTMNVPSWSPDSKMLAFVSYRLVP